MDNAQILIETRKILDEGRAWGRNRNYYEGKRCLRGAVIYAEEKKDRSGDMRSKSIENLLCQAIGEYRKNPYDNGHIISFNDNRSTS